MVMGNGFDAKKSADTAAYLLLASKGTGSTVVEAALELSRLPYEVEELSCSTLGPGSDRLRALNPLGQVPALVLPDGSVPTESAAIVMHIRARAPGVGLVPPADAETRPMFLRWFFFFVGAIYPTFTFGDEPERWVRDPAAGQQLRESTDRHREEMWLYVEGQISPEPWLIGAEFSILDIYVWVMTHWRPRGAWFAEHCPKLSAIALAVDGRSELAAVRARNFG